MSALGLKAASCRASEWFLRHNGPEFPCADEATAVVASLFQNYLPELKLKYDNRIAIIGNTPATPFIGSEFEPDIQSASPGALDWLEPAVRHNVDIILDHRSALYLSSIPPDRQDTRRVIYATVVLRQLIVLDGFHLSGDDRHFKGS